MPKSSSSSVVRAVDYIGFKKTWFLVEARPQVFSFIEAFLKLVLTVSLEARRQLPSKKVER